MRIDRIGRRLGAGQDEVGLVMDDPLDDFPLRKLERLGDRGGKVDVLLLTVLAPDELDLGRESHGGGAWSCN